MTPSASSASKSVNNDLEVRILTQDRRDDAELRGDVLQALMLGLPRRC